MAGIQNYVLKKNKKQKKSPTHEQETCPTHIHEHYMTREKRAKYAQSTKKTLYY